MMEQSHNIFELGFIFDRAVKQFVQDTEELETALDEILKSRDLRYSYALKKRVMSESLWAVKKLEFFNGSKPRWLKNTYMFVLLLTTLEKKEQRANALLADLRLKNKIIFIRKV